MQSDFHYYRREEFRINQKRINRKERGISHQSKMHLIKCVAMEQLLYFYLSSHYSIKLLK